MEDQPWDEEQAEVTIKARNVIKLDIVGIGVPTIKFEKDMLNGGAEEITTIKLVVRNLPKATQLELAAQSYANNVANVRIELMQPSIYMLKNVDAETGEVSEPISVDNPVDLSG